MEAVFRVDSYLQKVHIYIYGQYCEAESSDTNPNPMTAQ